MTTYHRRLVSSVVLGAVLAGLAVVGLVRLLAAPLAQPEDQPLNFVAAPALSTYDVGSGNAVAFGVWFENGAWQGDLIAQAVDSFGQVSATAQWKARSVFADPAWANANSITSTWWNTGRVVVSTDGGGAGWSGNQPGSDNRVKFRFNDGTATAGNALTLSQQAALGTNAAEQEKIVKFVRGYRGDERISSTQAAMTDRNLPANPGGTLRERYSILGDIIHSNPVYVGTRPALDYNFAGYESFRSSTTRGARVYVGANDGMLHAFDATNGREVFAYIPSMLVPKLPKLAKLAYTHTYFVDGELTAGDAYGDFDTCASKPCWRTLLVGGLGAGGKGFFALDVTETPASETEDTARARILWEIGAPSRPKDDDLGYTFGRPVITRLTSGKWVAVAGNGYDSNEGKAALYLIELASGTVHKVFVPDGKTPSATDKNGLSSPLVVVDQNYNAQYVYAGDLDGNLWRFDLRGQTSGSIDTSTISVRRLFRGSPDQPITAAPDFAPHPQGGLMIVFGTGRAFQESELSDTTDQYVIGVRDALSDSPPELVLANLARQTYTGATYTGVNPGLAVRIVNDEDQGIDYTVKSGWYVKLENGERVLTHVLVRAGRAFFSTTRPNVSPYENWLFQLHVLTGGTPTDDQDRPLTVFDLNGDFQRDINDRLDGNSDGDRNDLADIPVAQRLATGLTPIQLVSHPIVARVANGIAAILYTKEGLNTVEPPPACEIGCTGGFQGGHIDVDYYDSVDGVSDGHKHRYDKDQHVVYVDLFSLEPFKREVLKRVTELWTNKGYDKSQKFVVLMANADLSPGGKLYLGSAPPVRVIDYQRAIIDKIRNGTLTSADLYTIDNLDDILLPGNDPTESFGTIYGALRIAYNDASIIAGDLMPTNTGCVKDGPNVTYNRWHNGALVLQLMKVNSLAEANSLYANGKVVIQTRDPNEPYPSADPETGVRVASGAGSQFLYEVTLFWHWKDEDIPWYTPLSYLYQQLYGSKLSLACYGEPIWWTSWKYIREGLSNEELAQLQAKADQLAASGNKKDRDTAKKINQYLQEYKQKFQPPGSGGGAGGVPEVLPSETDGGGTSSGGQTNDYYIQQGLRSWRELGRD